MRTCARRRRQARGGRGSEGGEAAAGGAADRHGAGGAAARPRLEERDVVQREVGVAELEQEQLGDEGAFVVVVRAVVFPFGHGPGELAVQRVQDLRSGSVVGSGGPQWGLTV